MTAYTHTPGAVREELVRVGRGSLMGELLRRYWHPVALSEEATDTPRSIQVLGEELILFRTQAGLPGLLYPRCCHRGTSLYYGRVEDDGIRCCYHGWKFAPDGACLDQPCEPEGGRQKQRFRQPWYPVQERYGMVFAYLGPPERMPVLPRYRELEELAPGEILDTDGTGLGSGGWGTVPCNWMQHFENVMDPYHVPILHGVFSGPQFVAAMAVMPEVEFEATPRGVRSVQLRKLDDGRTLRRITEACFPTLRVVPSPRLGAGGRVESIGWVLPLDDTHFRILVAGRAREKGELGRMRSSYNGKAWTELTEAEHRAFPGDWEAQVGQGT
ncbi:MAG: Rieske 2Fe-2S domain-containing protein, partial [Alphaproteobacteria bacterium]|nr:Rieske 2Fe-2S domain-containing protein [Alphaproteobacteria bacterium]